VAPGYVAVQRGLYAGLPRRRPAGVGRLSRG
jgi:hypothetical protein